MHQGRVRAQHEPADRTHDRSHFDNAGHLDPERAARLETEAQTHLRPSEQAFVAGTKAEDDLAEGLGEGAVLAMTTGEDSVGTDLNHDVEEDFGGPFIETTANTEFASGTDESNIKDATREPFPTV